MNAWLVACPWLWQLAGWTMVHFLWIGAVAAIVGGAVRLACRRASPNVRYAASLATLAALAAIPLAIGVSLSANRDAGPIDAMEWSAETQRAAAPPGIALRWRAAANPVPVETGATQRFSEAERPADPTPHNDDSVPSFVTAHSDFIISPALLDAVVPYLPWAWLAGAPLTFLLLAAGLVGSRRLRRHGMALDDGPAFAACERLRTALGISRRVTLAVCDRIAQPVLVGIVRPMILLPTAALAGWSPVELEMVLLHELAHVRRWDNMVNLSQRLVESLLFFHPAVWLVSRQVRRDREECCDAIVVARTERPHEYAELLVAIAATLRGRGRPGSLVSAMADHPLAGRIRRILQLEDEPMRVSRRSLAAALIAPLLIATAAFYGIAAGDDSPPRSQGRSPDALPIGQIELEKAADPTAKKEQPRAPAVAAKDIEQLKQEFAALERQAKVARDTFEQYDKIREYVMNADAANGEVTRVILTELAAQSDPAVQELRGKLEEVKEKVRTVMEGEIEIPDDLGPLVRNLREARDAFNAAHQDAKTALGKQFQDDPDLILETVIREHAKAANILKEAEAELAAAQERLGKIQIDAVTSSIPVVLETSPALNETISSEVQEIRVISDEKQADESAKPEVSVMQWPASADGVTTAYLKIRLASGDRVLTHANQRLSPQEIEKRAMTHLALVRSPRVVERALKMRELRGLLKVNDPPRWVAKRVKASFPGDGEIMELRIEGTEETADIDRKLLTAVISAYLAEVEAVATPAAGGGDAPARGEATSAVYFYDGKTFQEWRSQWKHELKTERRIEALNALAAFARAGYAKEAAEAILDVAGEYDFSGYQPTDSSWEAKLRDAVILQLWSPNLPTDVWLPRLIDRVESRKEEWLPLLHAALRWKGHFGVPVGGIDAESGRMLLELAADPDYAPNAIVLVALKQSRELEPEVHRLIKDALRGDDADNALNLLTFLGFRDLEAFPEQLDLLFHKDMAVRCSSRTALARARFAELEAVAGRLLKTLDDPAQADRHADAIRALGVLQRFHWQANDENPKYSTATGKEVQRRLSVIVVNGPAELLPPVLVAYSGDTIEKARSKEAEILSNGGLTAGERQAAIESAFAKYNDELKQTITLGE